MTYIGINDQDIEGTLQTVTGEPIVYNNINPCSFCEPNSDNMDFVVMEPWGSSPAWSFSNFWNARKYVVEIPCAVSGSDCGFDTRVVNDFQNANDVYSDAIETANGIEVRYLRSKSNQIESVLKWNLTSNGNSTDISEKEYSTSNNFQNGFISTLGDFYFDQSENGQSAVLTKSDFNGNMIWSNNYPINGTTSSSEINSLGIWEDNDGILFTGFDESSSGFRTGFMIKTDLDGNEIWQKNFPDSRISRVLGTVSYTHLTLPTTPYV